MNKRFENFDYLRGFAMIGVVLIHITAPLVSSGDLWSWLFNQLSRFAVPVFFLLSGILFMYFTIIYSQYLQKVCLYPSSILLKVYF